VTFSILVVDDEPSIRTQLEEALQEAGWETAGADDGSVAAEMALKRSFDLCITDVRMPTMGGIELLERLRETSPETMVILMTAFGGLDTAIKALRLGAVDYLLKPFQHDELIAKVQRLVEHRRLVLENRNLRRVVDAAGNGGRSMLGTSPAMRQVLAMVDRVASLPSHVLITGESGTGKDLVARALHERGSRARAPFVPINCAAIPENLLESELFGHVILPQADARVRVVELRGEPAVVRVVARVAGVEQVERHLVAPHAAQAMAPGADVHRAAREFQRDRGRQPLQQVLRNPLHGLFALVAVGVEALAEVAAAVEERHPDHREPEVGRRAQAVAGEHPEPAGVRGDRRIEGDLHREVGDARLGGRTRVHVVTVLILPPSRPRAPRAGDAAERRTTPHADRGLHFARRGSRLARARGGRARRARAAPRRRRSSPKATLRSMAS